MLLFLGVIPCRSCSSEELLAAESAQKVSNYVRDARHFEKSAQGNLPRRIPYSRGAETEHHGRRHGARAPETVGATQAVTGHVDAANDCVVSLIFLRWNDKLDLNCSTKIMKSSDFYPKLKIQRRNF